MLDSVAVGQTSKVFEDKRANTLNVLKLIAKEQLPDSVQYRFITVGGADEAATKTTADSILNAVKAGGDFEVIAKNYGQGGQKVWFTTDMYQNEPSIDVENANIFKALNTMSVGEIREIPLSQAQVVLQVLDRKAFTTKYTAAVISKEITFSDDTYHQAFNKFSQFVSANLKAEDLEANAAANGYTVQTQSGLASTAHNVAGVSSTKELLRWVFEAKQGQVSKMTQCGENDHMLIVILDKINKSGYVTLAQPDVNEAVRSIVLQEKKAEQIEKTLANVKSVEDAQKAGGQVSTIENIQFSDTRGVYVQAVMTPEVALAGAVAGTPAGQFSSKPVRGTAGVYVFKVTNKETNKEAEFNAAALEKQLSNQRVQLLGRNYLMQELYENANVTDKRYLFF